MPSGRGGWVMWRALCIGLVIVAVSRDPTGVAQTQGRKITIVGAGGSSCGTWTALHRKGDVPAIDQWVVGFLSGVAWAGAASDYNPLKGTDANGVWQWVSNYCRDHPLDQITDATISFIHTHPR